MDTMDAPEIQSVIGELLAGGHADNDIIDTIVEEHELSSEKAYAELRKVYDGWQHTREVLDLNDSNMQDWHVFLRKRILQQALGDATIPSLKLALSVLDSLAAIQGISTAQGQVMPLSITLVEKAEEPDDVDREGDNVTEHSQGEPG